jgi:hypothetical protein
VPRSGDWSDIVADSDFFKRKPMPKPAPPSASLTGSRWLDSKRTRDGRRETAFRQCLDHPYASMHRAEKNNGEVNSEYRLIGR